MAQASFSLAMRAHLLHVVVRGNDGVAGFPPRQLPHAFFTFCFARASLSTGFLSHLLYAVVRGNDDDVYVGIDMCVILAH
jgi:hypothetical protein